MNEINEHNEEKSNVKKSKKTYNAITICLAILGAFLIIWYAAFAQPLAFNNIGVNEGNTWNIHFTNMIQKSIVGEAKAINKPDYTSTKATFSVSLTSPGDSITYELTVKNSGSLDAVVDSIYVLPENGTNDPIWYTVSDIEVGDELKAGAETTFKVTALYNPNITSTTNVNSKSVTIIINYRQK